MQIFRKAFIVFSRGALLGTLPLCHRLVGVAALGQHQPLAMYLARVGERHIVKRMPNTGTLHAFDCDHYEAPPTLSGLGDVMGTAIQEDDDGNAMLKLDVSLSRTGPRTGPTGPGKPQDSVKSDPQKLSLLALLHYLWHESELHRWSPGFAGKRNWGLVRHRLLEAAMHKSVKKNALADRLYIPEPFYKDRAAEIDSRRRSFLTNFRPSSASKRELFLLIGELKGIEPARYGSKAVIKHAPAFPVFLDEQAHKKLEKRFETEFAMAAANDNSHLMIIMTVSLNKANAACLEEASIMLVNENWIPIETADEFDLVNELTRSDRRFLKGMRFNVSDRPIASALLADAQPPVALFIVPPGADDAYEEAIAELTETSATAAWRWNVADGHWPAIPSPSSIGLNGTAQQQV